MGFQTTHIKFYYFSKNKMLYKISSMGYFGGVAKVSKGPWFRDYFVEDDGLDWFYTFLDNEGKKCYLLTNNMAVADREHM